MYYLIQKPQQKVNKFWLYISLNYIHSTCNLFSVEKTLARCVKVISPIRNIHPKVKFIRKKAHMSAYLTLYAIYVSIKKNYNCLDWCVEMIRKSVGLVYNCQTPLTFFGKCLVLLISFIQINFFEFFQNAPV